MSLMKMSSSGAVLILAIVVIRAIALHKLPKRIFPVLWGVVLIRLLLPVSLPPTYSAHSLTDKNVPILHTVENGMSNFTAGVLTGQPNNVENDVAQFLQNSVPEFPILQVFFVTGTIILTLIFLVSFLRCRREFQTALPVQNNFIMEWIQEHPLRRTIEIRQLTGLSTPLTYGVFHPVILIPKNTDCENERQVQYMLYHEYIHIRRFDAVGKLLVAMALCIHWFNPIVWVFYILYNRDVELACDESVVRHFGNENRASYARALIYMEEHRGAFVPFYNYFSKNAIEERIESIMKSNQKPLIVTVLAIVLMVALSMSAFAAESVEQSIAYRDLSTAATQVEYDAILAARYEIIYSSGPWTTTGVKIIKADGTLVDVPNFYDLFPEDWELPSAIVGQAEVDVSEPSEAMPETAKVSILNPSRMDIRAWSAPITTYSAYFNDNVYLPVADANQATTPFYYFTSDGYDVTCYAATLPGNKYNLGLNNEDTGKRIDWIPNLTVDDIAIAEYLTPMVRYSFAASVSSDPGYARMVVQTVSN